MALITKEWLSSGRTKPCQYQLDIFNAHWPNGAEVTEENLREAQKLGLGVDWVISNLLPASYMEQYKMDTLPYWEQYQKNTAPYREQYYNDTASLTEQYLKDIASLTEQYLKDIAPYREQYEKDTASLTEQYLKDTLLYWLKMVRSYLPRQG